MSRWHFKVVFGKKIPQLIFTTYIVKYCVYVWTLKIIYYKNLDKGNVEKKHS